MAGVVATIIGARNDASVFVSAGFADVAIHQSASGSLGTSRTEGLSETVVNGDYVTAYRSGGFGYVEVVSDAPALGRLGRGH